jgi:hypothetical protein
MGEILYVWLKRYTHNWNLINTAETLCMWQNYYAYCWNIICMAERLYVWLKYRVSINYRRSSLRHNLSRKCRKIVKFVSITHSELTFGMVL